jgi:hypothetical protein
MRIFTEIEQDLLKRISDGRGRNLYNLINSYIEGVSFTIDTNNNTLTINFEVQNLQTPNLLNILQDRLQKIQSILIQVVNLIKLFEDKGYIFTFRNAQQLPTSPFTFGRATTNLLSVSYAFPDPRVSKLFIDLSANEIFVTPELPKFISDGFITREEVRANRQYRITRNALIIAIIALLFNVVFNVYNKLTSDKDKGIKDSEIYRQFKIEKDIIHYEDNCHLGHKKNDATKIKK